MVRFCACTLTCTYGFPLFPLLLEAVNTCMNLGLYLNVGVLTKQDADNNYENRNLVTILSYAPKLTSLITRC